MPKSVLFEFTYHKIRKENRKFNCFHLLCLCRHISVRKTGTIKEFILISNGECENP